MRDRKLVLALKEPLTLAANEQLVIQIVQKFPGFEDINFGIHPVVGRFRIATTNDANPTADPVPAKVRQILSRPARPIPIDTGRSRCRVQPASVNAL